WRPMLRARPHQGPGPMKAVCVSSMILLSNLKRPPICARPLTREFHIRIAGFEPPKIGRRLVCCHSLENAVFPASPEKLDKPRTAAGSSPKQGREKPKNRLRCGGGRNIRLARPFDHIHWNAPYARSLELSTGILAA